MAMIQLEPPLPVSTPKGPGYAFMVIDYGMEFHLLWVVAQDETGEIWAWPNPEVRVRNNPSMGRNLD